MSIVIDGGGSITGLTATGISAVQQLPSGSVLQVVNATYSTQTGTSSATYADTGLTASITPKFTTSKVLVLVDMNVYKETTNTSGGFKLVRNSTDLIVLDTFAGYTNSASPAGVGSLSTNYSDSPATTSSTTYKIQFKSMNGTSAVYINTGGYGAITSTITLMEIAG